MALSSPVVIVECDKSIAKLSPSDRHWIFEAADAYNVVMVVVTLASQVTESDL